MPFPPISRSWQRIERWVTDTEMLQELPPPATDQDLTKAEQALGLWLPAELRELLLRHNGSRTFLLPPYFRILSTSDIVREWERRTTSSRTASTLRSFPATFPCRRRLRRRALSGH